MDHGDPQGGGRRYKTPEEAFAARTEWRGDCLVWVGGLTHGYGEIRLSRHKKVKAHRWNYENTHGPVSGDLHIDHTCYTKACCNVEHLQAVTPKQNAENRHRPNRSNKSGFMGVFWDNQVGRWKSVCTAQGKRLYGGSYPLYELHIAAYSVRRLRNNVYTNNRMDRE